MHGIHLKYQPHHLLATLQEAYCNMLVKFQEEMARPIQEATEFFKSVERQLQLGSISGNYFSIYGSLQTGSLPHREMLLGLCHGTEPAFFPRFGFVLLIRVIFVALFFFTVIALFIRGEGIRFACISPLV